MLITINLLLIPNYTTNIFMIKLLFLIIGLILTGCVQDEDRAEISTVPRTNNPHFIEDPNRSPFPMGRM